MIKVYLDKNGFVHLRKGKNRVYIGEFLKEAKEEGRIDVLLSPKLSKQACSALSNAKVESCATTDPLPARENLEIIKGERNEKG